LLSHDFQTPAYGWRPPARRRVKATITPRAPFVVGVASVLTAAVIGGSITVSPVLGGALAGVVVAVAVAAFFDVIGIATALIGALPWLIVFSDKLPRLTITLAAAAGAAVLWVIGRPVSDGSKFAGLLRIGAGLFFAPIIISLGKDGLGNGFSQAAKYVVFPLMVLVVTEATNRHDLIRLRAVALWSGVVAVAVNFLIGLSGIANVSYYGNGEILGLGSEHILALLAGSLAAASLATGLSLLWTPVVAVTSIAAVATGVRSVLPGLALAAITRMVSGRVRLRMMILVALAVVAVFVSGAAHIVQARYQAGVELGQYHSFSSFGSGRGEIYSAAVQGWVHSSPIYWAIGTGLRSIPKFEQQRLGEAFVGHSDIVEVGVQLGIVGLIGFLLMWRVLIQRADVRLPLFVVGSFALFNGVLEYSASVVIGLLLTMSAQPRVERVLEKRHRSPIQVPAIAPGTSA
jgi:hypothetical protein